MTQHNTCSTCPATWTGLTTCHCSACHITWSGIGLFDTHRRGGRCAPPQAMSGPLRLVSGVWRLPEMTDEDRAKLAG